MPPISVSAQFARLRAIGQAALIPFITAGDPDLETTAAALREFDRHGADLIELGLPYSDPLADGPVIQAAATRALQRGTTIDRVLDLVAQVAQDLLSPIILFTYYNPILNCGIDAFFQRIYAAGARGLVIPDLPLEEAQTVLAASASAGIETILLVAPTSPPDRLRAIAEQSQGFIYLVSTTGVTGMRDRLAESAQAQLAQLRQFTDKPIGVGFGISQPEHARQVIAWGADAAIVGSAFVQRLAEPDGLAAAAALCRELKQAIAPQ